MNDPFLKLFNTVVTNACARDQCETDAEQIVCLCYKRLSFHIARNFKTILYSSTGTFAFKTYYSDIILSVIFLLYYQECIKHIL